MKEVFLKTNKKFFLAALVAIFCISFSALFQTAFIIKSDVFNLSSFQIYITNILRVFSAFLIVPLFTFKNKELDKHSNSFAVGITIICGVMLIMLMAISPLIVIAMKNANTGIGMISNDDIWTYVILSNFSSIISLLESYFIYNMIFQNRLNESMFYSIISLVLKLFFTTLLITKLSPFVFQFWFISLTHVCAVGIMLLVLLIDYVIRNNDEKKIEIKKIFTYYKRGIMPGLEELIGTLVYVFFTLSIIDHRSMDWSAWNLSNNIMLWGIMNVTLILRYSLYYESMNSDEPGFRDTLQNYYLFLNLVVFSTLTIFYFFMIPLLINGSKEWDAGKWILLTRQTLVAMYPVMLMLEIKKQFEIKLINTNKFYFILINTIIDALLIKIPIGILWKTNVISIGYWLNLIIWGFGVFVVVSLTTFEYYLVKRNPDFDLKILIFKKKI